MESTGVEESRKFIAGLREIQNQTQKRLIEAKKSGDTAAADNVMNELKDVKAKITEAEEKFKKDYPGVPVIEKKKDKKAAAANAKQEAKVVSSSSQQNYGELPIHQSANQIKREWNKIQQLNAESSHVDKEIWIRARISSVRAKGNNLVFLVLRQSTFTIQAVIDDKTEGVPRDMVKWSGKLPEESLINIGGICVRSPVVIKTCTQKDVEIRIKQVWLESKSLVDKPIGIDEASRPIADIKAQKAELKKIDVQIEEIKKKSEGAEGDAKASAEAEISRLIEAKSRATKYTWPKMKMRLDNRILDLRTQTNQAIFRIQSGVGNLFREFLLSANFIEIHTPKLLGAASEGGADVFQVKYFNGSAYLAQSPQLYKQMAICADLERVFEIGPVFRAETSFTPRHLTEFVGLDLEMQIHDHYYEVLDMIDGMFQYIFAGLESRFSTELETIQKQFPFEPIKYKNPSPRLQFTEGMELLRNEIARIDAKLAEVNKALGGAAAGSPEFLAATQEKDSLEDEKKRAVGGDLDKTLDEFADISTPQEKLLGRLVKEKYGVDFYILEKYPVAARPFYTMLDSKDPRYTNSYDIFIRNEEICSGAQRVHDADMLAKRAVEKGVPVSSIQDYINAFKYGAPPHGGGGIGLERVVMLYLNLKNIRRTSMFPRDPARLTP